MVQVIRGERCHVVLDVQHFPLLFTKFVGDVTVEMFAEYFDWVVQINQRAQAEGTKIVTVTDGTQGSRPSADARAYIAAKQDEIVDAYGHLSLASYVALDSALVRGALTAIGWVAKRGLAVTPVRSIAEGVERALADFDAAGVPRPTSLPSTDYRFPKVDSP